VATTVRDAFLPMTAGILHAMIILIHLVVVSRPGVGMATTQIRTSIQIEHQRTWATLRKTQHTAGLNDLGRLEPNSMWLHESPLLG
jgi:hypothetical protein